MTDFEAYDMYPEDNWVYDKRKIAELYDVRFGETIPDNGQYIVKPYINLLGCSIASKVVKDLEFFNAPKGCCWFEYLEGIHWTVDFVKSEMGNWEITNVYIGNRSPHDHTKFDSWVRVLPENYSDFFDGFDPHVILDKVVMSPVVNFELIGNKPIEVHLRGNTDPVQWDIIIPVWENNERGCRVKYEPLGYKFIEDKEDHPGRVGFWVKNYGENNER